MQLMRGTFQGKFPAFRLPFLMVPWWFLGGSLEGVEGESGSERANVVTPYQVNRPLNQSSINPSKDLTIVARDRHQGGGPTNLQYPLTPCLGTPPTFPKAV